MGLYVLKEVKRSKASTLAICSIFLASRFVFGEWKRGRKEGSKKIFETKKKSKISIAFFFFFFLM